MGAFESGIRADARGLVRTVDSFSRKIALDVFKRVILKTPVDTGCARNGWLCSISAPVVEMARGEDWFQGQSVGGYDKSGRAAIEAAAFEVVAWEPAKVAIYLTNNLPYIQRLEDGYSGQSPSGMVEITLAEFDGIVARIAG